MLSVRSLPAALALGMALLQNATVSFAAQREPWTDARLPTIDGLALWLDAATIARDGSAPLRLSAWRDGSGQGRDLVQVSQTARPKVALVGQTPVVRFDGIDDFLEATELDQEFAELTAFLVACPFDNPGGFRGFVAANRKGGNDYTSGFTVDLGGYTSARFESLNAEGIGFGGAQDMMQEAFDFGTPHLLTVYSGIGNQGVQLFVDGQPSGQREREDGNIRMDHLTLGARCYNNAGPDPFVQGFLEADIAEVLLFDRRLSDSDREAVESYLRTKHAELLKSKVDRPPVSDNARRLVSVPCPPVQFFVPGFTFSEIPVELTNINYLKYRHDSVLVAGGYDGRIWLIRDTNGDGLEDEASLYHESPRIKFVLGLGVTAPDHPSGAGVLVLTPGQVLFVPDRDGDGKGDAEITVASDWTPPRVAAGGGVSDALGLAVDRDGNVWFGLGTSDFTSPYLVNEAGQSEYPLAVDRGTIQRVSADFRSRETICTGIRFPVGMAFNARGDLFCTDQEGATWLPNGNPFDELLHIERGRHYGFPPRHPKHLPTVIDEPSVFDFTPQHQSTCGMFFNEPADAGPNFGPDWWRGDAFVCGESRGKLWRMKLVKTEAGYVAQSQLVAGLAMMPIDAALSPRGDLVVTCHSGGPDWGTGPGGKGKLYKVRAAAPDPPRPVLVHATDPSEVRIAFDQPLPPESLAGLAERVTVEFGPSVAAGDRFEAFRPGYEIVHAQMNQPRVELPVHSVQVTPDRRTLVLSTAPHSSAVGYAITIAEQPLSAGATSAKGSTTVPSRDIDVAYDLSGVQAEWRAANGAASWTGWLPHINSDVSRELTGNSADHEQFWELVRQPGELVLRTQLRLDDMLRPTVQPGSTIDYQWPPEVVSLNLRGNGSIAVEGVSSTDDAREVEWKHAAEARVPVVIRAQTGEDFRLFLRWSTDEDARPRALPLRRFLLPWATIGEATTVPIVRELPPELAGGSWSRGWKIFFDAQVGCAKCHSVHGRGEKIGPDLSNLAHRDYASVLRDIEQPSFSINPDFISHSIALKDGRVLSGVVKNAGGKLHVGNVRAEVTIVDADEVEFIQPSTESAMPTEQSKQLGPERLRDLLTFLLSPPPRMPEYGRDVAPPPPRTWAEVTSVLSGADEVQMPLRPLHVVLVAGPKDHGPGEHDYPAWQTAWRELLGIAANTTVTTASPWPSDEQFVQADVLVFYQQGSWTAERAAQIDSFLKRGGGLVYLHFAVDGGADPSGFAQRIGLAWQGGQSRFRHGPLDLEFTRGSGHPIARNFERVHFHDESYWNLVGDPRRIELLASGDEEGRAQPLFWTHQPQPGRVFVSILGHYSWTFDDPLFRTLVLRGILWSAGEPIDRFNELTTIGARVE